jgi:Protein of unknown function (DUF2891)
MAKGVSAELAGRFAGLALGHVEREYPHKLDHVLTGPEDAQTPSALHPIFHGSFDWHSCVHGYWTLARLLRLQPGHANAAATRALFARQFTTAKIGAELDYVLRPSSRGFERPYGWAWLLYLQAELARHETPKGQAWAAGLAPLAAAFADRFKAFLPIADYPLRAGVHSNTAFALTLAIGYAEICGDTELAALAKATAVRWYGQDRDCQAWEPSGDEFLSSALMEAECMRHCLGGAAFADWFTGFLPRLADRSPASLFAPASVSDRSDGKIAHLDGLNLSRAWCWGAIAGTLPAGDPRRAVCEDAARLHLEAGLPHLAGDYMGEHWLASFALLALTEG